MKKKILIIILISTLILIGLITYLKLSYPKKPSNYLPQDQINEPTLINTKTINICKKEPNCPYKNKNIYGDISFEFDNQEMQNWIKEINKETNNYYQKAIEATTDNEICKEIQDEYSHYIIDTNVYIYYIGKKHISLSIQRISTNICTNQSTTTPTKIFLYSKQKQKQITNEELKKELNLTEEEIKTKIKNSIESFTEIPENFNLSNYNLYYDRTGTLLAEYYLETNNTYHSVAIQY